MQVSENETIVRLHDYILECDVPGEAAVDCRFLPLIGADDEQPKPEGEDTPVIIGIVLRCEVHRTTFLITGQQLRIRTTEIIYARTEGSTT